MVGSMSTFMMGSIHSLHRWLVSLFARYYGYLDVIGLEVAEEGESVAEDRVIADAGLPERLDHLGPDLPVAAHVLFFVPRPDLQNHAYRVIQPSLSQYRHRASR